MPMAAVRMPAVTNSTVWPMWNIVTNTPLYVPATTTATWTNWNANYTGATTATGATTLILPPPYTWAAWSTAHEETREQRAEREQRAAAAVQARDAERAILAQARDRALELLGFVLSDDQMRTYREHGWFEIRSSKGRRWRIRDRGQSGNVDLMPEIGDERVATYCAHPPADAGRLLPAADAHLAQALTLVSDEDAFLRVANCQYRRAA